MAPRKHNNLVWDESQLPANWYDWKIAGSHSQQFSLPTAEQGLHAVHLFDVQICLSKDGEVVNYDMLVTLLKVDEIIIYSKVFSRRRIISPEILPLVSNKKAKSHLPSGRVFVLCSTGVITDSYNNSYVFLQSVCLFNVFL